VAVAMRVESANEGSRRLVANARGSRPGRRRGECRASAL